MSINKKIWIGEVASLSMCTLAAFAITPLLLLSMADRGDTVTSSTVVFVLGFTVIQILLLNTLCTVI